MSYSKGSRYESRSRSPYRDDRSVSRSRSRSRSRDSSDVENPGNNLYVTGLSLRITKDEIERHFSSEGKVVDVHLVMDPWTRESRGFAFVTMSTLKEADRCLKYLDGSVLGGRIITIEKARRRRGRTPTPGRYLGLRTVHARRRSPSYSPYYRGRSPGYYSRSDRSYSPHYRRRQSCSRSPYGHSSRRRCRSYSSDSRSYTPPSGQYRRYDRSISRSVTPRRRRGSCSISPRVRRTSRSYSRSYSPRVRRSKRSLTYSESPRRRKRYSWESCSHSRSVDSYSRSP